jgi:hypothetical protein
MTSFPSATARAIEREPDAELRLANARAVCADVSAVQPDQPLDQRQSKPEAAFAPIQGVIGLHDRGADAVDCAACSGRASWDALPAVRAASRNRGWHLGGPGGPWREGCLTQKNPVRKD